MQIASNKQLKSGFGAQERAGGPNRINMLIDGPHVSSGAQLMFTELNQQGHTIQWEGEAGDSWAPLPHFIPASPSGSL